VSADLLEQDRRLHPPEADTPVGFGQRYPQPPLVGQRAPQDFVVGTAGFQMSPDLIVSGAVIEEGACSPA
jgi:hypothetical protein